jgi:invasion protein IalB
MQLKTILARSVCVAVLVAAAPAIAQNQPNASSTSKQPDPDRIICEKIQETGSRLSIRRVCATAQQWEEQRRRDREAVQDAQQRRTEPSGG